MGHPVGVSPTLEENIKLFSKEVLPNYTPTKLIFIDRLLCDSGLEGKKKNNEQNKIHDLILLTFQQTVTNNKQWRNISSGKKMEQ